MTIRELKQHINSIPEDKDNYEATLRYWEPTSDGWIDTTDTIDKIVVNNFERRVFISNPNILL